MVFLQRIYCVIKDLFSLKICCILQGVLEVLRHVYTSVLFHADERDPMAVEAQTIRSQFFTSQTLATIFVAIMDEYLPLKQEDLELWETDPEAFGECSCWLQQIKDQKSNEMNELCFPFKYWSTGRCTRLVPLPEVFCCCVLSYPNLNLWDHHWFGRKILNLKNLKIFPERSIFRLCFQNVV